VVDAFLEAAPASAPPRPDLVVAAPGAGATVQVSAALADGPGTAAMHDLGDAVGVQLGRWEREGLASAATSAPVVLIWCVKGSEATSLAAGLVLGRLAALLEPVAATVLWLPEGPWAAGRPSPPACDRVRRLVTVAAPRARVSVHCVGWEGDTTGDVGALAARFA
jgi:hypothetical protein